ncbi:putative UDP-rhamnose:rhamnosyltransferase 1 [Acorus calamus]|uniref:UDP-rhamnose:rhamnosyltransferase 1 n=1 Tax=Acorus calamus TaxID=4465 RepID=A0AAV9DH30_ACOCL|nr:putative UDP-rhamnose:rhamnosyltransferase 1 [Acorus calamus]
MEGGATGRLHIVVFPWLAFGHMLPFLELSKSLAKLGHRITYVSTPKNLSRLPPNPSPNITFVALPSQAESTTDVPADAVPHLKKAFDALQSPFARLLRDYSPDWVLLDFASHWAPDVASDLGIPCAYFSVFPSVLLAVMSSLDAPDMDFNRFTSPPDWVTFPTKVAFLPFETHQLQFILRPNESGVSDAHRVFHTIRGCRALLVRGCREFEAEWLAPLAGLYGTQVVPVGFLPPEEMEEDRKKHDLAWLDRQSPKSVVYVAFGSEFLPSADQLRELALGLEECGLPFFWALRDAPLPEGFEDRTRGRGFVCRTWVPQMRILGHKSIRGFVTHGGWSSVIEGLYFGLPLVLFPISVAQNLLARMIGEKGLGAEVPRGMADGSVTSGEVAETVRLVMVGEGGEGIRGRAWEMKGLFGDGALHGRYVEELVKFLRDDKSGESLSVGAASA